MAGDRKQIWDHKIHFNNFQIQNDLPNAYMERLYQIRSITVDIINTTSMPRAFIFNLGAESQWIGTKATPFFPQTPDE